MDDAVKIIFIEEGKTDEAYFLGVKKSKDIRRKIDEFGPKLIHFIIPDLAGLDTIQYARDNEIPLMGTYHNNMIDYLVRYSLSS